MGVYNRARSFQQPRGSMPRNDRIVRVETVKRALLSSRQGVLLKVLADRHEWKLRNLYRDIDALDALTCELGFRICVSSLERSASRRGRN